MPKPTQKTPEIVDLTPSELENLFQRLDTCNLSESDKRLVKGSMQLCIWLKEKYEAGKVGFYKLARLLFGNQSEKRGKPGKEKIPEEETTSEQSGDKDKETDPSYNCSGPVNSQHCKVDPQSSMSGLIKQEQPQEKEKTRVKGHGRLGADAYPNAEDVTITHPTLKPGDPCLEECGGKLYSIDPGIFIRITGQDIAKVTRYHIEKLRCNTCGVTIKGSFPEKAGEGKYDYRLKAILTVQKYFVGVPFYRQEDFQKLMHFPLSDSTQWDLIEQVADSVYPIMRAMERKAAQAQVIHNDDTPVKIVEVIQLNKKDPTRKRTGMFTSGIYAKFKDGLRIMLYYSGIRHAGENLALILKHRSKDLKPIIHMCDALSANLTKFLVKLAICMSHGRRKFIEIEPFFPEECRFVIEQFALVYYNDAQAKKAGLSGKKRLAYHKEHSGPVMKKLKKWLDKQIRDKLVEPNSGLGQAIAYLRRHWKGLTLFLSQVDAPLDNNILEQALKIPIRLRKNSLIHRTCHGANVASMLMSIIQTCRLSKINPVDYLTVLQENKSAVFKDPDDWLPWCYKEALQKKVTLELMAA